MSLNQTKTGEALEQSPGYDPRSGSKRNSGLFAFLKWFKASTSHESIASTPSSSPNSSKHASTTSLNSVASNATVASFSYIPPSAYAARSPPNRLEDAPETDTYKARLKQRDDRREKDKNTTLGKKYNLFFFVNRAKNEATTKSLPLMTRTGPEADDDDRLHRRTNSESSKTKKAGAYVHVKGKRRAPQPPAAPNGGTLSLRRRKRLAPAPPNASMSTDTLKLENGVLLNKVDVGPVAAPASVVEAGAALAPRPWYKRNSAVVEEKVEKRKSGMSYLTNISELDREASEIVRKKSELPEFMRPKEEEIRAEWGAGPRRRSAKDLIAKFNAITSVTKATVFGVDRSKRDYFGRRHSEEDAGKKQANMMELHKKRIEEIDAKKMNGLMKSESASVIRNVNNNEVKGAKKAGTPKSDRKSWKCPKCNLENEYWRIICHVCSAIKPYFDDFAPHTPKQKVEEEKLVKKAPEMNLLERSKTQIGFSALSTYNSEKNDRKISDDREKLKKMLIEMKNSLPKRKSNILAKQESRTSIIIEKEEAAPVAESKKEPEKTIIEPKKTIIEPEKITEIVVATRETIYENIKIKKTDPPLQKAVKVSSTCQTSSVSAQKYVKPMKAEQTYELMRPKDFETIYTDSNSQSPAKIYANLARNDELSLFFQMPKNLPIIKQLKEKSVNNTDTIEINRLLRRLETAIAKGELTEAAIFAKELAQLKINCSVVRQKTENGAKKQAGFTVEMFVEDKISHRGPFNIEVTPNQTVAELKLQVEQEFEIPADVQRWILGKELATNDNATLKDHKIVAEKSPIFLYLVAPHEKNDEKSDHSPKIVEVIPKVPQPSTSKAETAPTKAEFEDFDDFDAKTLKPDKKAVSNEWECHLCTLLNPISSNICAVCATIKLGQPQKAKRAPKAPQTYQQLVNLDNRDLVETQEAFECVICYLEVAPRGGVTLRECLHQFCKLCLANTIEFSEDAEIKCPFRDENYSCQMPLQDREIKALVSAELYEKHQKKSMNEAENKIGKSFHCKTPNCRGWCVFEDNVNQFGCPVCKKSNCLTCQAIHAGLDCKQYQEKMKEASEIDEDAKQTREMVEEMVRKGEALNCPTCHVILMKKWGCDWVRCSMCKTEICWVTKGLRWGPGGKGDTSGGCKCGVNGVKCHPQCCYCH